MTPIASSAARQPSYLSFAVDGLDPSVTPCKNTPESGGLAGAQNIEIIRGCYGIISTGYYLVEVSHPR
jgi:arginase family enzyme